MPTPPRAPVNGGGILTRAIGPVPLPGGGTTRLAVTTLIFALLATALLIWAEQRESRTQLTDSLRTAATASAEFTQVAVEELGRRQAIAGARIADEVTDEALTSIAETLGVGFALVLDAEGELLAVHPSRELDAGALVAAFPHLQRALTGHVGVSATLEAPSFPSGVAIAVAAPFEGVDGLRVLSTAFDRDVTILGGNLRGLRTTPSTSAWLVDEAGGLVATGRGEEPPPAVPEETNEVVEIDDDLVGVRVPVQGTPWSVVAIAPRDELFAPLRGWSYWQPWFFLAVGAMAAGVLVRLSSTQRRLSMELSEANAELEATANRMREFVAVASHELRTPAGVILGFAKLLSRRDQAMTPEARAEVIERLSRSSERLARLTEELTAQASTDRGELALTVQGIALGEVLAEAAASSSTPTDQIQYDVGDDLTVLADHEHTRDILRNLIDNAGSYGHPPVTVTAQAHDSVVEVRVRDHGNGVPEEFRSQLFERFSRADAGANASGVQGTGLGLSLSRGVAELMGGSLDHEPASPGACFVLRLPAAPAAPAD